MRYIILALVILQAGNVYPVSVTKIEPSHGNTDGSSTITIYGSSFGTSPTSSVGGVACDSLVLNADGTLDCKVAAGTGTGKSVVVTNAGANSGTGTYFSYNAPTISTVTPSVATGGATITLDGSNFGISSPAGASGSVGGPSCASLTWISNTRFKCIISSGCGGEKSIIITVSGQVSQLNQKQFSYNSPTVSSLTPSSGNITGSETLTVSGSHFGTSSCSSVLYLYGYACSSTTRTSSSELTCVTSEMWDSAKLGVAAEAKVTTSSQSGILATGWTWLYDECAAGNNTCGNSTCTDTAASYACAASPSDSAADDSGESAMDDTEKSLTGAAAASTTATAIVTSIALTSAGNMLMVGGGSMGGGAAGSAVSPSSVALIEQIQFLSTLAALDVSIPGSISAFTQSLQWSNGMVSQYLFTIPVQSTTRRLFSASEATGLSVEETFIHQILSAVVGLVLVFVFHVLVIYLCLPLVCRHVLRRKTYRIDPTFLLPGFELLVIMATYQGISLITTTVLYNTGTIHYAYTALAVLILVLYSLPLPFVIILFIWISIWKRKKARYVSDPLPNFVECLKCPRFLKNYFFARGHWEGNTNFKGRFGLLFAAVTYRTHTYVGWNMLFKFLRCVIIGVLVGFLEGKFQIGSLIILHTSRWLWVLGSPTSSNRVMDWQSILLWPVEILLLAIMVMLPAKGLSLEGDRYKMHTKSILYISMFLIYAQIIPMILTSAMQIFSLVWEKIKQTLLKRNKKVVDAVYNVTFLNRRRTEIFLRCNLDLDVGKYTIIEDGKRIFDESAAQEGWLDFDSVRYMDDPARLKQGKPSLFSANISYQTVSKYVRFKSHMYREIPMFFNICISHRVRNDEDYIGNTGWRKTRHDNAYPGDILAYRRERNWTTISPLPLEQTRLLITDRTILRGGAWDPVSNKIRTTIRGFDPLFIVDQNNKELIISASEISVYEESSKRNFFTFKKKRVIQRRNSTTSQDGLLAHQWSSAEIGPTGPAAAAALESPHEFV